VRVQKIAATRHAHRYPIIPVGFVLQLKSGRTSSPRLAVGLAHKARLDIGQPEIIGPGIATDGDRVAAAVVGAVNQETANAALARLVERDLLGWADPDVSSSAAASSGSLIAQDLAVVARDIL